MKTARSNIGFSLATLLSGSVLAQVVVLLAYPVVTRLFSPEDFGLFNVFYSYIEVLIILSTGKYELALPVAEDDAEAKAVARLSLWLNGVVSSLLLAVIALLIGFDALPGKTDDLGLVALLVPFMVFFSGTSRIYSFLFNRYKQYRPIAASDIVGASAGSLLKIGFGMLASSFLWLFRWGLPLATVLGQAAANVNYLLRLRRLPQAISPSRVELKRVAAKFRNFPLFTMPKDFVSSFSYNLPFLWLALYFDKAEVGLFALALTFTFRPANIINTAMERVFYVRTVERVRSHQPVLRDLGRLVLCLNAIAVPVCLLLFLFAEPLFGFFFGNRWNGCGLYVRMLLPWTLVVLTSSSLSFLPNIFSTQGKEFVFYIVLLVLRIVSLWVGLSAGSFPLAIMLFSASGAVVSLLLIIWYFWQIHRRYESNGCRLDERQ